MSDEMLIAVFIDFENLALGVRDVRGGKFQIDLVLKRLLEKGRIVFKRGYCDWSRFTEEMNDFHGHGIELVDIPRSAVSGKNSADIRMVVDAIDLSYAKQHIDTFALLSGDSDFSPLVSKLKENDKRVLGCGVKGSTSQLLVANCDEFIYYDDLVREAKASRRTKSKDDKVSGTKQEAFERLAETVRSLQSEYEPLWGSIVKQTIRRVYPGFNERFYGFDSFTALLKEAETLGHIALDYDADRGNYKLGVP